MDKLLQESLHEPLKRVQEMELSNSGELGFKPRRQLEEPYKAWDTSTLDFFDPRSPDYDQETLDLLLKAKKEDLLQKYGKSTGLSEAEAEKLALALLLSGGFEPRKRDRTESEEKAAQLMEAHPEKNIPEGMKSFYPGQTQGAKIFPRPKDPSGRPTRNRFTRYDPESGEIQPFTS
jgi:hypothetical protein